MTRWRIVLSIARNESRARARRSFLGRHWSVVWPLAETAAFVVVFGLLLRLRGAADGYLLFVLIGVFSWRVLFRAVTAAGGAASAQALLLSTFDVRIRHVVIASMLGTLRESGAGAAVVVGMTFLLLGLPAPAGVLWVAVAALLFVGTMAGLSLLAAVGGALSADVRRGLGPVLTMLMFAAPVVYPVDVVPAAWQTLFLANPVAAALTALRHGLMGTPAPPPVPLMAAAMAAAGLVVVGWRVATLAEDRMREVSC